MVDDHLEQSYAEESWQAQMLRVCNDLRRIIFASRDAITQSQASIALADKAVVGALIRRQY